MRSSKREQGKSMPVAPIRCCPGRPWTESMPHPLPASSVTDTIPLNEKAAACNKIKVLSISSLVGEAIIRSYTGDSVTSLFV